MQIIRERHSKSREELKELFISLILENGQGKAIQWNDFEFAGKSYGTRVEGEIFDDEIHVEISGMFEKHAAQKLREGWKKLVIKGLV